MELRKKIDETVSFIRKKSKVRPLVGIVLGSGLGNLAKNIQKDAEIPYKDIPNFAHSTAMGHKGNLILGELGNTTVAAMEGRLHFYEGWTLEQVTFPVRIMKALGCTYLFVSNAAGGMNPRYRRGDLVIIEDHINLMGVNPLIGPNDESLGPRFPDMSHPYDSALIDLAERTSLKLGMKLHQGTYAAMTGPCFETRAEYRLLRVVGADLIGMSTVPEVIVAVHAGLKVFGMSIVSDVCIPDHLEPITGEEVIKIANEAEPKLSSIFQEMIKSLKS